MRKQIAEYDNGNVHVIRFSDGTVIRFSEDDEFNFAFPENMDVKITNRCTGTNCPYCFVAGTKILMGDFTYKNIEDVKVGDEIIGVEEFVSQKGQKRKTVKSKVLKTFVHVEDELLRIKTSNNKEVTCTPNHPFLVEGYGKNHSRNFRKIQDVKIGYDLFSTYYYPIDIDYNSKQYNLGYLVGAWTGDGHIGHCIDGNGHHMYTCRYVTLDEEINDKTYEVTKPYCDVYRLDFAVGDKDVRSSVRSGKEETYSILNKIINENLKINNSIEYACGFLSGFYDAEGHIDKERKTIRICNTNIRYIEEVERCLDMLNIEHTREKVSGEDKKTHKLTVYNVRVKGNGGWSNFLRLVRPHCIRKGLEAHIFDVPQYDKTHLIKAEYVYEKQYVYNLETDCHTYTANDLIVHNCHEGSGPRGKHGDILNAEWVDSLYPYTEMAIGGGNALEHPDLLPFLIKLKEKKVFANLTVNQMHFLQNQDKLFTWTAEGLIHGLGVSLVKPTEELFEALKKFPNAVVHVIAGIVSQNDLDMLMLHGEDLKVLILGYKDIRRGAEYRIENHKQYLKNDTISITIDERIRVAEEKMESIFKTIKVVSFDCLAIEQLHVKDHLPPQVWDRFYQGEDGTMTFYIDMVNQQFAESSTAPFDDRYDIGDKSVKDMFKEIKEKHNGNRI